MKKLILFVMFVMLAGFVSAQVDTQYFGYTQNIIVGLNKQEPDPVEPGKEVEVTFKLDNNGTATNGVVFEIVPEYPFSLLPDESPSHYIGKLATSQYGRYSVVKKYRLKVAQDTADDNYKLKVRYKNENMDSWATLDNFRIKVQTHDAILAVDKVLTLPPVTAPGDKTKLRIELKNYATSLLKDIKISLNLDKSGDDTRPFAPVGSTNEKIIPYMEPQSVATVEFDLLVDSDVASKSYKVPLNIGYSDVLNKNYSKSSLVTIIVGANPDLGITLERTDVYTSGSSGNVVLRLVNKGNPDIRFLNVKVLQNENIKVIGADEVYIGKLDSDDFSTAEFKLYVNGKNSIKIPVQVTYKDTNNNDYKENREVELKLYSSSEAKNFGVQKSNNTVWIIVALAVIAGAYYYYSRRRSKK